MNAIHEKLKEEYLYAWDKAEAENCLAVYDSVSSSCSKKAYADFLVHSSSRKKHIWASNKQLTVKQCVCSFIYFCSFFMSLELLNHPLRIQTGYSLILFHLPPTSMASVEIQRKV